MFWIIIVIIALICILYMLKDEIFKKKFVVTVVKHLPLNFFKKENNKNAKKNDIIKEEVNDEVTATIDEAIEENIDVVEDSIEEEKKNTDIIEKDVNVVEDNSDRAEDEINLVKYNVDVKEDSEIINNIFEENKNNEDINEQIMSKIISEENDSEENDIFTQEALNEEEKLESDFIKDKYEALESEELLSSKDIEITTKDDILEENTDVVIEDSEPTVYWTPNGKSYHLKNTCRTLSRSKVINSGTLEDCGKDSMCIHCK